MMGIVELMKAIVMNFFEVIKGIYLQQKYLIINCFKHSINLHYFFN